MLSHFQKHTEYTRKSKMKNRKFKILISTLKSQQNSSRQVPFLKTKSFILSKEIILYLTRKRKFIFYQQFALWFCTWGKIIRKILIKKKKNPKLSNYIKKSHTNTKPQYYVPLPLVKNSIKNKSIYAKLLWGVFVDTDVSFGTIWVIIWYLYFQIWQIENSPRLHNSLPFCLDILLLRYRMTCLNAFTYNYGSLQAHFLENKETVYIKVIIFKCRGTPSCLFSYSL